ncbi:MAG: ligand-binding sensor domain-containing protein [Flammeovirgaceae bacterium]
MGASRLIDNRVEDFNLKNGLASSQIGAIAEDHEGQVWLGGGFSSGLSLFLGRHFERVNQGLSSEIIMGITKDQEGGLWAGSVNELVRYTFTNSSESNIANIEKIKTPNGTSTSALYTDSRGLIWMGFTGGVASYDLKTKKITDYSRLLPNSNRPVISISEDKNGQIWISLFRNSCFRLNMNGNKAISADNFTTKEGLVSNVIWKIFRDKNADLWFGSNDKGLSKYDGTSFTTLSVAEGLPHNRPAAITEDASGNLWFASIGGGIFRYDGADFKVYTTKDGLDSNNPYLIQGDDLGNIWIGTNKGLNRLNPTTNEVAKFSFEEGFAGMETNQNVTYKDKWQLMVRNCGRYNEMYSYRFRKEFSSSTNFFRESSTFSERYDSDYGQRISA